MPTEWTHLKEQLVPGVSDSKMKDAPKKKNANTSKKGTMTKTEDDFEMSKMTKMSESSKESPMAKKSESATNR